MAAKATPMLNPSRSQPSDPRTPVRHSKGGAAGTWIPGIYAPEYSIVSFRGGNSIRVAHLGQDRLVLTPSGEIGSNSDAISIWESSMESRRRLPALASLGSVIITGDCGFCSRVHKIFLTVSDLVPRSCETAGRFTVYHKIHPYRVAMCLHCQLKS